MRLLNKEIINKSLNLKYKTMSSYCFKCRKNTESINPSVSRFIKKQEASRILSNLGLKTPLNKIPLLGDILF